MNLQSILNKDSPWAHMELGFDVLGIALKLVKYVVCSSKKQNKITSH
jgi:homoserine kinase